MRSFILVIEKHDAARLELVASLERLNHFAVGFRDAKSGLGVLGAIRFDAMIVCLEAYETELIQLLISARIFQRTIATIMIGGRALPDGLTQFVDAFVPKPYNEQEVDRIIDNAIRSTRS